MAKVTFRAFEQAHKYEIGDPRGNREPFFDRFKVAEALLAKQRDMTETLDVFLARQGSTRSRPGEDVVAVRLLRELIRRHIARGDTTLAQTRTAVALLASRGVE